MGRLSEGLCPRKTFQQIASYDGGCNNIEEDVGCRWKGKETRIMQS